MLKLMNKLNVPDGDIEKKNGESINPTTTTGYHKPFFLNKGVKNTLYFNYFILSKNVLMFWLVCTCNLLKREVM